MSALFVLIGISLLVAGGFLAAFLWATRSGQFDDDYTPSVRILFDEFKSREAGAIQKDNWHETNGKG